MDLASIEEKIKKHSCYVDACGGPGDCPTTCGEYVAEKIDALCANLRASEERAGKAEKSLCESQAREVGLKDHERRAVAAYESSQCQLGEEMFHAEKAERERDEARAKLAAALKAKEEAEKRIDDMLVSVDKRRKAAESRVRSLEADLKAERERAEKALDASRDFWAMYDRSIEIRCETAQFAIDAERRINNSLPSARCEAKSDRLARALNTIADGRSGRFDCVEIARAALQDAPAPPSKPPK